MLVEVCFVNRLSTFDLLVCIYPESLSLAFCKREIDSTMSFPSRAELAGLPEGEITVALRFVEMKIFVVLGPSEVFESGVCISASVRQWKSFGSIVTSLVRSPLTESEDPLFLLFYLPP